MATRTRTDTDTDTRATEDLRLLSQRVQHLQDLVLQEVELGGKRMTRIELLDVLAVRSSDADLLKAVDDAATLSSENQRMIAELQASTTHAQKRNEALHRTTLGTMGVLSVAGMSVMGVGFLVRSRQMDRLEKRTRYLVHNQADTTELNKRLDDLERGVEDAKRYVQQHDARMTEFFGTFINRAEKAIEIRETVH